MSRLRPNWLLGIVTNLKGVTEDELSSAKLLVVRNGMILSEGAGNDYTYDGTNLDFLIDIQPQDAILLIDPSIGAVRKLLGGTTIVEEEPEVVEVAPPPAPEPVKTPVVTEEPVVTEVSDVTSSDSGRDDEASEAPADDDSQSRKGSSRRRRT